MNEQSLAQRISSRQGQIDWLARKLSRARDRKLSSGLPGIESKIATLTAANDRERQWIEDMRLGRF